MVIYTIWDCRNNEFFGNSKAKKIWTTKGAAKNAVMLHHGGHRNYILDKYYETELDATWLRSSAWEDQYLAFDKQTRFVCREYNLQNTEFKVV